jgi:transposase-like protein
MDQTQMALPRSFCWNENYPDCGKSDHGNIRKFGRPAKGTQRHQCKSCEKTFVETKGAVFYGRHHSQDTTLECLAWLAERSSLAAIQRVKGINEETVAAWLQEAVKHVEEIEALLIADYHLTRAQLDAMWSYVGNKGEKGDTRKNTSEVPSGAARQ